MTKGFLDGSAEFIDKHILDIILVVLVFFVVLVYNVINNITYSKSHPVLEKVVIFEK